MRFADHAYTHACDRPADPARGDALDRKAEEAGHTNTADYIHDVQGAEGTRSFVTSDGRTCWANKEAGLYGWNNPSDPTASTVVPARDSEKNFEVQKQNEASKQGVEKDEIIEKGPLSEQDRQAPDAPARKDDPDQGQGQGGPSGSAPPTPPASEQPPPGQGANEASAADAKPARRLPPPAPPPPQAEETYSDSNTQGRGR
jgi:hypothetical protein